MDEFKRLELLVGKDNLDKIKSIHVIVVGLGGVGGYVAEALARCGISNLTLVDYDKVDITNINRQIIALHSTIGKYKTEVFRKRIMDINPSCHVTVINEKILDNNLDLLFMKKPDYIVDACDTVITKISLIKYAVDNNIKIISSMGTGNKMNPTKLTITDISKTQYDPLARIIRRKLKELGINKKVPVVCSMEPPKKVTGNVISSNAFVPSIAGLYIASYIINDIVGEI